MAYPGWLSFAGTELANVARTVAYTQHAIPSLTVRDTYDSDDLHLLLGDRVYSGPQTDDAPWYSPNDPNSADFYGFYPLAVQGVDDGTVDVQVTELLGDGAVLSKPRMASRSVRVSGVLLGATQAALQSGKSWLRGALTGPDCTTGDCTGADLCFLSYLPAWCDYSDYPDVPLDLDDAALDEASWRAHDDTNLNGSPTALIFGSEGGAAISRWVDGLIPGQPYRLSLDIGSTSTLVTIAVSGAGSTVVDATLEGAVRTLGLRGPYVHDFVAAATSHEVTIGQVTPGATSIYAMQVARTPVLLTTARMRFLDTDIYEPNSWTFVATPANVAATATISSTPDLRLDWVATTGTPNVTTAVYARRLLRGLTVGRQYTLHAALSTNNGQDVTLAIGGDSLTFTPTTTGHDWVELHFTATAAQHEVHVGWGETFATSSTAARIRLDYMRLDVDDPSMLLEDPDLLDPAVRTLHQVSLISGPTVVQDFAPTTGAMQKIEFVLVAGSPYAYAPLVPVPSPFDGTYQVVPDTACSLGQPIRQNRITNPSFETNTTGWTAGGGTLSRVVGVGKSGVAFGRVTADGTASAFITSAAITVLPGSAYTLSAYVRSTVAARFQAFLRSGSTSLLVENITVTPTGDMTRIEVTTVIPAGVTTITARIAGANPNGSNPTAGGLFDFDAIQFEAGAHASPYFDGSTSGGAWTGTAHASASTWTTIHTALIRDPDCTPIPAPPRPPIVIDDCIGSPTSWRRYHVVIPESDVPPWSAAVPIVTMSTRATAVRQIRVRFTAMPFAIPVDQIDPCNFCGEFLVSYIPPNSTLTVDGILSQATINVRDTGLQTAQNLLYGTDAGPVVWPTLSCEVAYVMTVDVSPNEVTDFDVRLALARRE